MRLCCRALVLSAAFLPWRRQAPRKGEKARRLADDDATRKKVLTQVGSWHLRSLEAAPHEQRG